MNDAYLKVPFADVLYFADKKWWEWHKERDEFKAFSGEKATVFTTGHLVDDPEIAMLRNAGTEGFSVDPAEICTGTNSGHQAINIAYLAGAKRIVLVGYDAKQGENRKAHFFGAHPDKTESPYANQIRELRTAQKFFAEQKVEVLNATPGSAIPYFPMVMLEEACERIAS